MPRTAAHARAAPDGAATLQVGAAEHLDFGAALPAARFTQHACDPNGDMVITADAASFVARRDVAAGDLLTFDYTTTEYDMAAPFECACGGPRCLGAVRGYRHLDAAQRMERRGRASAAVRGLAAADAAAAAAG